METITLLETQTSACVVPVTPADLSGAATNALTRQFHLLFDRAPVGVAVLGPGPDLIFEMANDAYCELTGRPARQLIGLPLLQSMPELAGNGFDDRLMDVINTGVCYVNRETELAITRYGKPETLYTDFVAQPRLDMYTGQITGVIIIVTNITAAVRARQHIEANQQLLNAMIGQTPLGVAVYNGPEFIIELANPTLCQLLDRTRDQLLNQPLFSALPETRHQGFEELLTTVFNTGVAFRGHEIPATIRRNGQLETVYFDFVYEPLRSPDGAIDRVMLVTTDVTGVRKARLAMAESEARYRDMAVELDERVKQRTHDLERSNLDLIQFASVASHDLKEPLRKIQTFGTLLTDTLAGRLTDEEADLFRRLISSTARMQTLVSDVLRLSKLADQSVEFTPVDLNVTVSLIREDLELYISERSASLVVSSLPTVFAETGQMHQLFLNLITNALKFNEHQLPVVWIKHVPITSELVAELGLPSQHYAVITVTDNGIGFNEKHKDRIFGMFQRLTGHSQYSGTGIGLAIVKKIVENHRGAITVCSQPGQGTTFLLAFPVSEQGESA